MRLGAAIASAFAHLPGAECARQCDDDRLRRGCPIGNAQAQTEIFAAHQYFYLPFAWRPLFWVAGIALHLVDAWQNERRYGPYF